MKQYFDYDEIVRATNSFSPARLVGKGSHGSVFAAKLPDDNLVAVKTSVHGDSNSKLQNEIRILSSLSLNPHVITFLGTCRGQLLLVMEFMPNGSLHHLLHVSKTPPSWPKRLQIVLEIAAAVRFLHDESRPSVVHRDIKSENVLFDSCHSAKLADFGLAAFCHVDSPGRPAGTIGYLDPCYTTPARLGPQNDAFSFGVLVLEIVSGKKVIDMSRDPARIADWAVPLIRQRRVAEVCDQRVSLPADVAGAVRHVLFVAASCVSLDEGCRPAMSDVVSGLECRFLERDRFRVWRRLSMVFMRRRRKVAKRWREKFAALQTNMENNINNNNNNNHYNRTQYCGSNRKMLLREFLDVNIEDFHHDRL